MDSKIILIAYYLLIIPTILIFGFLMRKKDNEWYKYIASFIESSDIELIGKDKLMAMVRNTILTMLGLSIILLFFAYRYMESNISFVILLLMTVIPLMPMALLEMRLMSLRMLNKDIK